MSASKTSAIKCILCADRKDDIQEAYTCISCFEFLVSNGYRYNGETIETYKAIFAGILARPENSKFLAEIVARRQKLEQSVLDAIASAFSAKAGA